MAPTESSSTVLRLIVICAFLGYLLTWLLHLTMAQLWRSLSPYEVYDGTMIALTGSLLSAFLGLFVGRISKTHHIRIVASAALLLLVPVFIAVASFSGLVAAEMLLRMSGHNNDNRLISLGYYIMPPIWVAIVIWVVCWFYKAQSGGVSILVAVDAERPKDGDVDVGN